MPWVMTLIDGSGSPGMLADIAAAIVRALHISGEPDWLAPGMACDLPVDGIAPDAAESVAREAIGGAAIDLVMQPIEGRRKRLLVADLESTIIENEMLDELADFIGMRTQVAEITRRAMNGELDFAAALAERVAGFGRLYGLRRADRGLSRLRPGRRKPPGHRWRPDRRYRANADRRSRR